MRAYWTKDGQLTDEGNAISKEVGQYLEKLFKKEKIGRQTLALEAIVIHAVTLQSAITRLRLLGKREGK